MVAVKTILKRLRIKTDLEVSKLFGVSPNTISIWKARNTMNYQKLIIICAKNNIPVDSVVEEKPVISGMEYSLFSYYSTSSMS